MLSLLHTLKELSVTASEVLPFLEQHDYREEAKSDMSDTLPLEILPKRLKEITDSVLRYCVPLIDCHDNLPKGQLLNRSNMQRFIENLNTIGDNKLIHQLQFIQLTSIREVAEHFAELGFNNQSRLLSNVYEFASKLKTANRSNTFCTSSTNSQPIHINFIVPKDELDETETRNAQCYKEFCAIFKTGVLLTAQKRAIFESFNSIFEDSSKGKPHLIITAAIILLMTKSQYGKPLTGSFNGIRSTVFTSLGQSPNTAKSYGIASLKKDVSPSLLKYRHEAETLLHNALGNTR